MSIMTSQLLTQLIKQKKCSVFKDQAQQFEFNFLYNEANNTLHLEGQEPELKTDYDFASANEAFDKFISIIQAEDSNIEADHFIRKEKKLIIHEDLLKKYQLKSQNADDASARQSKSSTDIVEQMINMGLCSNVTSQAKRQRSLSNTSYFSNKNADNPENNLQGRHRSISLQEKVSSKLPYHVLTTEKQLTDLTTKLEERGYNVVTKAVAVGQKTITVSDKRNNAIYVTIETSERLGDVVNIDIKEDDDTYQRASKMDAFAECNQLLFNEVSEEKRANLVIELVDAANIHEIAEAAHACLKKDLPISLAKKWLDKEEQFIKILKELDQTSYEKYHKISQEEQMTHIGCGA